VAAFIIGGAVGFGCGVLSTKAARQFLKDAVSQERPAGVASPIVLDRPGFKLSYPSNWTIKTTDSDYDPDHNFFIESPGTAFAIFIVGKGEDDPRTTLQGMTQAYKRRMSNFTSTPTNNYGRFQGVGANLKGSILGIKTTIRVSCFCKEGRSVCVVEYCSDEDMMQVKGGFSLMEDSLVLKPAKH
jgi:hypothetical protein